MSETIATLNHLPSRRLKALVVPREHGAWGMLLIPLVVGAAVGLGSGAAIGSLLSFAVAALLLFWLRTPVESLLGTTPMRAQSSEERKFVALFAIGLSIVAATLLSLLLVHEENRGLVLIGSVAGFAFAVQAVVKRMHRRMRMPAQIIGALGLSSCAPAAYYVLTGDLNTQAIALWLTSWLFAADQIHFVQLNIHGAKTAGARNRIHQGFFFLCGQALMVAGILIASHVGFFPSLTIAAFAPVLGRGLLWFFENSKPLSVRRLGWTELVHGLVFGLLLTLVFRLK